MENQLHTQRGKMAATLPLPPPQQQSEPAARKPRPLKGFLIAGASLAALFGLAFLKGRVKDQIEENE